VARVMQKVLLVVTVLAVLGVLMSGVAGAATKQEESTSPQTTTKNGTEKANAPSVSPKGDASSSSNVSLNSEDVIDTTGDVNSEISAFGENATETYGQTVTVPDGFPVLNSFTFLMNLPSTTIFRGEVYAWDGQKATGKKLFESKPMTTAGSGSNEQITFDTGGKKLKAGKQYVLFATVSKDPGGSGAGSWPLVTPGTYSDGQFVFDNNTKFKQLARKPWDGVSGVANDDAGFKAVFASQG
jgi:hypothetical protein